MTTSHTRAIYYNTPQNPAGTVFTREEAEEVAAFAKKHDLIVIADEAYEDLVYEGEHFSIASLPGMAERTISAFTFSKSYGMTGWRVGYLTAKEPFMTGLRKLVLYSVNGVSTPSQWAALEALSLPEEDLREAARRIPGTPRPARRRPQRAWPWSAKRRTARSMLSRGWHRSIKIAGRRRRSCWKKPMSRPSPASFLAPRAKVIFALGTRPRSKRSTTAWRLCGASSKGSPRLDD